MAANAPAPTTPAPATGQPLLVANKVTRRFGGLVAVSEVDFTIAERSISSLIGPNGAGKTTFFNLIAGLYKPSSGEILFKGKRLDTTSPHQITRLGIARTFREKQLPCDALIYLGTEFTPSGCNTRNGEFTWKKENFPEPKKMIDDLHAQHFRVVLHSVIEGRRMSGAVTDPSGNSWTIATHKEDVERHELKTRAEKFIKEQQQKHKAA